MPYMQLLAAWHLADLIVWRHLWDPLRLWIKELVPVRSSPQSYHLSLSCMFANSPLRKPTLSLLMIVKLGKPYLHLNTHLSCACLPALGVSLQKHKICLRCFSYRLWCDFPFHLHSGVVHLSQSPLPTRCAGEHTLEAVMWIYVWRDGDLVWIRVRTTLGQTQATSWVQNWRSILYNPKDVILIYVSPH